MDLRLYSVSDKYIGFLQKEIPGVYSNKEGHRNHTRKYIGVVIVLNGFNYYVPLSSPKETDYQRAGDQMVIKKSIVPIIRILVKNSKGEKELKGTLRVSHMIPVPESELELYDLDNEADENYKNLVSQEIIFIRKNKEKIMGNADLIYKQKARGDHTAKYVETALDYERLETLCKSFIEQSNQE